MNFRRNIYENSKNTMNTLVQSTGGQWPLINLTGDYITFDISSKKNQKVRSDPPGGDQRSQAAPGPQAALKIVGTHKHPYFCGKYLCEILGYESTKNALQIHVKPKHKKDLKTLSEEVDKNDPTFFGSDHFKNISYNAGKAVYLDRIGLSMLLQKSKVSNPSTIQAILDNPIIKELGVDLNLVLLSKEQEYIGAIVEAFHDLKSYKQSYRTFRIRA